MVYYTGHGSKENGSWLVYLDKPTADPNDERISMADIFDIIYESDYKGNV